MKARQAAKAETWPARLANPYQLILKVAKPLTLRLKII